MATRTLAAIEVPVQTTCRYRATLFREDGSPLPSDDLASLQLTLYAVDAFQTVINGLSQQDILNNDRGTVSAQGLLTVTLRPEDTIILKAPPDRTETRIMLLEATYDGGAKAARHEFLFRIRNLAKVGGA